MSADRRYRKRKRIDRAALGIDDERLAIVSYGEELPVCREATEACWAKDRRGRFVILQRAPSP
jgi:hypothetical protein